MALDAVLWDYDGTLVNSVAKNIDITKSILAEVAPHLTGDNLPAALRDEDLYHQANHGAENWRDLYQRYLDLTEDETLLAGSKWAPYQQANQTPVVLFAGMKEALDTSSHMAHGICSQNSRANIRNVLKRHDLDHLFKAVIGYDSIPNDRQKPDPHGGLVCLDQIFAQRIPKSVAYVGDHEADVVFARNLQKALGSKARVISIAVTYSRSEPDSWAIQPDHIAASPADLPSLFGLYQ